MKPQNPFLTKFWCWWSTAPLNQVEGVNLSGRNYIIKSTLRDGLLMLKATNGGDLVVWKFAFRPPVTEATEAHFSSETEVH